MRTTLPLLAVVSAVAACSSMNQGDPTARAEPHTVTMHERQASGLDRTLFVELVNDYHAPVVPLLVPADRAWDQTIRVYQEVGLPITKYDTTTRHIASEGWNLKREMLGKPMSYWLDCGQGAMGLRRADRYRIVGTLESIVEVQDRQTLLLTSLRARAYDESGDSSNPVPCSSTGELEKYIANQVTIRTAS